MDISFNSASAVGGSDGYGYASQHIINSLTRLNHRVFLKDPSVNIQLHFSQPDYYSEFNQGHFNIAYTPWESSDLPRDWLQKFNGADEVWTTSDLCAKWYKDAGVTRPIFVYKHGIENVWTPKKRGGKDTVRFLHLGEPSPRKGGQMAFDAFRTAFGNSNKVKLTIKSNGHNTTRIYQPGTKNIVGLPDNFSNVTVINEDLDINNLVKLYHRHDVLVYPSWGEGFGFIPLQALATGMPTICTGGWAPYKKFLSPLTLPSTLEKSPWFIHPGKMFHPDFDQLVRRMKYAANHIDTLSDTYLAKSRLVHEEYDWLALTRNAFERLSNTVGTL